MDFLVENQGLSWIAIKIFAILQPKDLVNCRRVSKSWKDLIDSEHQLWKPLIQEVSELIQNCVQNRFGVKRYPDLEWILKHELTSFTERTIQLVSKLKSFQRSGLTHPLAYATIKGDIEFLELLRIGKTNFNVMVELKYASLINMTSSVETASLIGKLLANQKTASLLELTSVFNQIESVSEEITDPNLEKPQPQRGLLDYSEKPKTLLPETLWNLEVIHPNILFSGVMGNSAGNAGQRG